MKTTIKHVNSIDEMIESMAAREDKLGITDLDTDDNGVVHGGWPNIKGHLYTTKRDKNEFTITSDSGCSDEAQRKIRYVMSEDNILNELRNLEAEFKEYEPKLNQSDKFLGYNDKQKLEKLEGKLGIVNHMYSELPEKRNPEIEKLSAQLGFYKSRAQFKEKEDSLTKMTDGTTAMTAIFGAYGVLLPIVGHYAVEALPVLDSALNFAPGECLTISSVMLAASALVTAAGVPTVIKKAYNLHKEKKLLKQKEAKLGMSD